MKFFVHDIVFANTLLLIILTFLFLKLLDRGMSGLIMASLLIAMALCILLLAYFLSHYMKIPPSDNQ